MSAIVSYAKTIKLLFYENQNPLMNMKLFFS